MSVLETGLAPVPSRGQPRAASPTRGPSRLALSWPLPQQRGEFHPLDKTQEEKMPLECMMLREQAAIMSQPCLGCGDPAKHILPVVMGTVGTN